ncbi:hypothetical protein NKI54_32405 [Mesorhizobium sp. M0663]|uniref:hypothetical protein n=1 Tax=unclassified Mesorhizobium TaxID=325217 RepID=UPI00333D7984
MFHDMTLPGAVLLLEPDDLMVPLDDQTTAARITACLVLDHVEAEPLALAYFAEPWCFSSPADEAAVFRRW